MVKTKKYKLFASPSAGAAACAFFASPEGCRNGDNCKFAHDAANNSKSGVISSETDSSSEEEEEDGQIVLEPIVKKKKKESSPFPPILEKKKKQRKRKAEDLFANPNKKSIVISQQETPTKKKSKSKKEAKKEVKKEVKKEASVVSFLDLDLPIAAFATPSNKTKTTNDDPSEKPKRTATPKQRDDSDDDDDDDNVLVLPTSTPVGRKWMDALGKTRENPRYESAFDFDKAKSQNDDVWIKARPYGTWCADHPQAIAIDCEMCETTDPVSGTVNHNALCRVSVVDAEHPDRVLLDSLVKPAWPVTNHRTWVNGISQQDLKDVRFTLRHAQSFMMALCSQETVIVGHALHNDLAALRMEHHCNVDSALLFCVQDEPQATASLKDLTKSVLQHDMPTIHDSVHDARMALLCLEHYLDQEGNVAPVPRSNNYNKQLFVHRVPTVCKPEHIHTMLLAHTHVQPVRVDEIQFGDSFGKTHVTFCSHKHANLSFETLEGKAETDKSGRLQKKVFLRNGQHIWVRKMAHQKNKKPE